MEQQQQHQAAYFQSDRSASNAMASGYQVEATGQDVPLSGSEPRLVLRRKRLVKAIMVFSAAILILCGAQLARAQAQRVASAAAGDGYSNSSSTILVASAQPTGGSSAGTASSGSASGAPVARGVVRDGRISLVVNKSAVITTNAPVARVQIGNPEIADFNTISPTNVLLNAKKAGNTQLIVWDKDDKSQVIEVSVEMDMESLQGQLSGMFPNTKIEVAQLNGAIALRGRVPSLEVAEQAAAVASPYAPRVLNLLEVSGGQQVLLQVRFAEVSRTAVNQLGINYNYASGAFIGGSNVGQVNPSSRMPSAGQVGVTPPADGFPIGGPTPVNPGVTLYGAGQFGNFYFEYFIQALRQNNLLRVLAEPNLIATSGQEARFLAGGEYPIPVTQGGGTGGVAVTVEYRQYGVMLRFVPVVTGNGRIKLKVAPQVSDLDYTTAVRFNGFVIPGLITREVETTLELADGQSFAIAGLLNNTVIASKDVTPGLGDLPVIGALWRSVRYQRKETELVVLVTPRLVEAMNPGQVPTLPGEKWRDPTEAELFWNRDIGGEMPDKRRAPATRPVTQNADALPRRFVGSYGFAPATDGTSGSPEGSRPTPTNGPNQTPDLAPPSATSADTKEERTTANGDGDGGVELDR